MLLKRAFLKTHGRSEIQTDLHDGAAVSFGVVDVEGDEVLAFNAGAAVVVDPYVFPLEAQLEELTLGDGNLHLGVLTVHLCLKDVVVACGAEAERVPSSVFGGI